MEPGDLGSEPNRQERMVLVMALFEAVVDLPPGERETYLAEHAPDDAVRDEVLRLVAADDAGAVLPVPEPPGSWMARGHEHPDHIGPFRIVRLLGQGGMGRVYEAEQAVPRRRVALKVMRGAWLGPRMLARFRQEVRVLGSLRHPGIAQIYEAGTDDDQPYFAMELVEGRPLPEYCEREGLDLRARLALVARVCDALHHAHQKGFVHRDLKPSKLLVDESEPEPRPKILDFGVARATGADLQTVTRQTSPGEIVGTLAYMSPEQSSGDPRLIDQRSDIYSMGVVLFELLSGRLPLEVRDLPLHQALQVIREEDPRRLGSVAPSTRGDVETIVGKALARLPEERYASVAELAADLRRHLADEPIVARQPSALYQLRKFGRRNRLLVGSAATVFTLLVASVVTLSIAVREARAQRDEARVQGGIRDEINRFLTEDILGTANPRHQVDRDLTVRAALDQAAEGIGTRFADQPRVESAIRAVIGDSYLRLTELEPALEQLDRAAALLETHAPNSRDRFDVLLLLGPALCDLDRLDEAERRLDEATQMAERLLPPGDRTWLEILSARAEVAYRRDDLRSARAAYEQLIERATNPADQLLMDAKGSLALVLQRSGELDRAEQLGREAYEAYRATFGPEDPNALTILNNLGLIEIDRRDFAAADEILQQVHETRLRTLGPDHLDTLVSQAMIGRSLRDQGRHDEAAAVLEETLESFEATVGREHPYTQVTLELLARNAELAGDPEGARYWRSLR